MKHAVLGLAITISSLLASSFALAQRPVSATYDAGRQVKLQGIVTRIDWVNPNAFFFIDTRDTAGTVTNWAIQIGNPLDLERDGWKPSALRVGDTVAVEGNPARSDARQ